VGHAPRNSVVKIAKIFYARIPMSGVVSSSSFLQASGPLIDVSGVYAPPNAASSDKGPTPSKIALSTETEPTRVTIDRRTFSSLRLPQANWVSRNRGIFEEKGKATEIDEFAIFWMKNGQVQADPENFLDEEVEKALAKKTASSKPEGQVQQIGRFTLRKEARSQSSDMGQK
jgi:hypothetical protein